MKRAAFVTAGVLAVALTAAYGTAAALSDTGSAGAATAQAALAQHGSVTTPVVTAKLLGVNVPSALTALTTNLATPLVNLPDTMTSALAAGITGAGLSATNPTQAQPRPSGTYNFPTCGQQGWTDPGDCYGPAVPGVSAASIGLTVGAAQGYATGDSDGYVAAAGTAQADLTLLGVDLGDLGTVQATAGCDASSTCTAGQQLGDGSLFGGALTYSLVNGNVVAKVGAVTIGSTAVAVTSSVQASVTATNLLKLTITLSTSQLLGALGDTLSSLGGLLGGTLTDNGTTGTLTVTIGPGNTTTTGSSAKAWGIDVNASLSADVKLNLSVLGLGLVKLEVTASGQLIDFKLAYSEADAGSLPAEWVPPALI
jgi:hypothetical protein